MSSLSYKTTKEVSKPFWKNWFLWVGVIGLATIVIFTIFWGYKYIFQIPIQKQAELEIEFKAIAPMPNAKLIKYSSSQKITNALVTADYLTDINPVEIFKYYDEQLTQNGWQFQSTTELKDWDRDLGGKTVDYCKGDYAAELQYAGKKANYGWTYALGISWRLGDCKKTP